MFMVKLPPRDMTVSAQPLYVVEHVVEKTTTQFRSQIHLGQKQYHLITSNL